MKDYWSDAAISINWPLTGDHFNRFHVYLVPEWDVPSVGKAGYLHWFLNGDLVLCSRGWLWCRYFEWAKKLHTNKHSNHLEAMPCGRCTSSKVCACKDGF